VSISADRAVRLTDQQRAAVETPSARVLLVAPPGSGKTEVLTRRTLRLLETTPLEASRILAVTYTVRAAAELRARVQTATKEEAWRVDASTLHAFALDWLRRFGSAVGVSSNPVVLSDDADRLMILAEYIRSLGEPDPLEYDKAGLATVLKEIDAARDGSSIDFRRVTGSFSGVPKAELCEAYLAALDANEAIDFPGMLTKLIELFEGDPWQWDNFSETYTDVLVDEGQDITRAQSDALALLARPPVKLFVVADERQSINRFAGGGFENARRLFEGDYERMTLMHNFRCASLILEAAERLGGRRTGLNSVPAEYAPPGEVTVVPAASRVDEASVVLQWVERLLETGLLPVALNPGEDQRVSPEQIAVLGRARWHLDEVLAALAEAGIDTSVQIEPSGRFESAIARIAFDALAVAASEKDRPAARRIGEELAGLGVEPSAAGDPLDWLSSSGVPRLAGLGETLRRHDQGDVISVKAVATILQNDPASLQDARRLLGLLQEYEREIQVRQRHLSGFLNYVQRRQQARPSDPGVRVLTVHRAKGLEFRAVAIVGLYNGGFPDYRAHDDVSLNDERRTFYVAMTRAARALLLTWPKATVDRFGRAHSQTVSQFVQEAGLG
jgi:ATP-dependent DNA helicase UvrD/PcrA